MMLHGILMECCTCSGSVDAPCWGCQWREIVEGVAWAIRTFDRLSEAQRADAWDLGLHAGLDAFDRWSPSGTAGLRKYVAKVVEQELATLLRGSTKVGHVGEHTLRKLEKRREETEEETFSAAPVEAAAHVMTDDRGADERLHSLRQSARLAALAQHDKWVAVAMAVADRAPMPEITKSFGCNPKQVAAEVPAAMARARAMLEQGADLAAAAIASWCASVASFRPPVVERVGIPAPLKHAPPVPVASRAALPYWFTFTPAAGPRPAGCRSRVPHSARPAGKRDKRRTASWVRARVERPGLPEWLQPWPDQGGFPRWGPARAAPLAAA